MPTRDTLLFSLSRPLFLCLSLSVFLASPTGHTINCLLHASLLYFHCSIPSSLLLRDRCGEVHDVEGRDGERVCVFKCVSV